MWFWLLYTKHYILWNTCLNCLFLELLMTWKHFFINKSIFQCIEFFSIMLIYNDYIALHWCFLSSLSWDIEGATFGTQCGEIESGSALVFEKDGRRRVCTPYLDTTSYGNLRFYFTMGIEIHPRNFGWIKQNFILKILQCFLYISY